MAIAATTAVVDAAYAALDADMVLIGRGAKERAHPWQDTDLPKWMVAWESERATGYSGGLYDCQLDLVFTAHCRGEGANAAADAMRLAAQTALMASGKLGGVVRHIRFAEAGRETDETGAAIHGTVRARFTVEYDADVKGVLEA